MNQSQIKEILRKKDSRKIDSYILKNARKKQEETDLMNLLQTWLHCLLYYKQIYPQQVFVSRKIFGIPVFTASAPALKNYLNDFFSKIKSQLPHINNLKVLLYSSTGQLIESNVLHIQQFGIKRRIEEEIEGVKPVNSLQQRIEMKQFLASLRPQLMKGFVRQKQEKVSFKLRIGYRLEQSNRKDESFVLESWLKCEKGFQKGEILLSLKSENLNLIYQLQS